MTAQNNSDDYQKVKDVFVAALDVAPEKRRAFLKTYGADAKLLAEVESLLQAREEAGGFLNDISAADTVRSFADTNGKYIGRKIGNYRIEKEIGRGGMGIVFLATREDFRQQAAVKLIKRGMDSEAILNRFCREREILAALNHPFIARLTDGGTTSDDAPFFVMEYVEGVPVDEFCRRENSSEKATLELFRKICEAVAFAHQKLIIHRDLKPSNILVTADGTPKLLDFGIAKLLDSTDANETQTNQRALTPAYASPEQINGKPIDTTSDVYSLGKILAQLLGMRTVECGVRNEDSKSLSENANVISRQQKNIPHSAFRTPHSKDLQNILAMALREDSARRYGSVEKFSEDLRRYLAGLPVSARKDTFSYRTAKFIQRKSYSIALAALFVLTLLGGIITTFWQAREAQRERAIAERRFDNLRKMSDSFTKDIHGAIENLPGSLPARQMLMRRAVEQLDALAAESDDNPALQDELAQAYFNSAQLPDMLLAEKDLTLKKQIGIYQKLSAADPENIHYQEQAALGYIALSDITKVRGSVAGAFDLEQTGIALLEEIAKNDPADASHLVNLAAAYQDLSTLYVFKGDLDNAVRTTLRESETIEQIRKLNPAEPSLKYLSDVVRLRTGVEQMLEGDLNTAIETINPLLADYETAHLKTPNDTGIRYFLWIINRRLAETYEKNGDPKAAEHYRKALFIIENLAAESPKDYGYHRNSAATNILYGKMLVRRKQYSEAAALFRRAVESSERVLENDADNAESKIDLARANGYLGNALNLTGKKEEGVKYLKEAVALFETDLLSDTENAESRSDYAEFRQSLDQDLLLAEIKK